MKGGLPGWLRQLVQGWRHLTGDDAYARYLVHQARAHPEATPLSAAAFWQQEMERKYSGVRRCC